MENGIFQRLKDAPRKQLRFEGERVTWIQASTLKELLDLKAQHPEAKLVVGNTEIGKGLGQLGACLGARDPLRNQGTLNLHKTPGFGDLFPPIVGCGSSEKRRLLPCSHFPVSCVGLILIMPPSRVVLSIN